MTSSAGSSGESTIAEMRTITLSNNKGGSGKTTMTVCLAAAFAERGLRVLVVDLDPQGSATQWLGGEELAIGLVELSTGGIRVSELVRSTSTPGVDLIPTCPSLVPSGEQTGNDTGVAIIRGFARLPDYWDLILVDTPPVLGYLSLSPLVASDHVVIPVETHALALHGVGTVATSIERARQRVNSSLHLLGIVACRLSATNQTRAVVANLRAQFGNVVLENAVRESTRIAEAPAFQLPITTYAPASAVANDVRAVAGELLARLGDLDS